MPQIKTTLTGQEALSAAALFSVALNKHADPLEPARDEISLEEAREIAKVDPQLIHITEAELAYVIRDQQIAAPTTREAGSRPRRWRRCGLPCASRQSRRARRRRLRSSRRQARRLDRPLTILRALASGHVRVQDPDTTALIPVRARDVRGAAHAAHQPRQWRRVRRAIYAQHQIRR